MFNARLFKFDKRINSTKQPPTAPASSKEVLIELKDGTNIFEPVITITHAVFNDQTFENPCDYNYVYIHAFKRYYFVTGGWTWENGIWSVGLSVDVLASFKTEIGSANMYVLRAASAFDGAITDTKYPAKPARLQVYQQVTTNPWKTGLGSSSLSDGFYCVGILNSSAGAVGATSYYAFTGAGMRTFIKKMFDSPSWLNVTDSSISTDLQKLFLNPTQYVMSAIWIPLPFPVVGTTPVTDLPYGWWSLSGVTAYPMDTLSLSFSKDLFIQSMYDNPYIDSSNREEYLNMQPWATCAVECFPFGVIPVDTCVMRQRNADNIYVSVVMDCITGRAQLIIETKAGSGSRQYLASASAQVGVPIPMAQLTIDYGGLGSALTYVKTAAALGTSEQTLTDIESAAKSMIRSSSAYVSPGNADRSSSVFSPNFSWSDLRAESKEKNGDMLSSIKSVAADIGNGLAMALGTPEVQGSAGGFAGLYRKPAVIWQFSEQVTKDVQHYGRPLCAKRVINTLSGFVLVQCGDDFTADCQPAERAQIVKLLEGGFYYE